MSGFLSKPGRTATLRPDLTAEVTARTGLNDDVLAVLVYRFYDRVRTDPLLGPIFATRIDDWDPHLEKMTAFWSSVALMTGRYHGRPVQAHLPLQVEWVHFEHWLTLFRQTAEEVCTESGAALIIGKAERIAASLHGAITDARR